MGKASGTELFPELLAVFLQEMIYIRLQFGYNDKIHWLSRRSVWQEDR